MLTYSEPLFRPPSEADSLIVQVTDGCPYNKCRFCAMYKTKKYSEKSEAQLREHLDMLSRHEYYGQNRVFLADGDSMQMATPTLISYMNIVSQAFPSIRRFSAYASVFSLADKTVDELKKLKKTGLWVAHLGLESGDEDVLRKMKKYMEPVEMIKVCRRAITAGIKLSVMIIIGLGGRAGSDAHIRNSIKLVNSIEPNYTSLLSLMLEHTPLEKEEYFKSFTIEDYINEVSNFIMGISCRTVFRSNHASNYIPLEGFLPRDKEKLLEYIKKIQQVEGY